MRGRWKDRSCLACAARSDSEAAPVASDQPTGRKWRVLCRVIVLGICAAVAAVVVMEVRHTSSASAESVRAGLARLRTCESSNNYAINTGNDHYGAYQFDLSTWRSVGARVTRTGLGGRAGCPGADLYRMRGWQPWQCAPIVRAE